MRASLAISLLLSPSTDRVVMDVALQTIADETEVLPAGVELC